MRRTALTLLTVLALAIPTALWCQDSTTTPTHTGTPTFRAGQWAALFSASGGFYGVGALRFSTPAKAWVLTGNLTASHNAQDPGAYESDYFVTSLSVGRRWFRQGAGRVRPYTELGVSGSYNWGKTGASGGSSKSQGYGGGLYGQLGAQIFFAPELSLGAAWNASVMYRHDHIDSGYGGGPYGSNDRSTFVADGGRVQLVGTLYF